MRNTDTTKYRGFTLVLVKSKQFMPLLRRPACYSYKTDVFDITMPKQTQVNVTKYQTETTDYADLYLLSIFIICI
jgi:hypothetical protein